MPEPTPTQTWVVDFPTGWIAERKEEKVIARSPRGGEVELATVVVTDSGTDPVKWAATAARVDRAKGREVSEASFGAFRGYETRFTSAGTAYHAWVLAAGDLSLDVTYKCQKADAGRDDDELRQILASLQVPLPDDR